MKAFLLIAIIACATAGNTFLGNYRENLEKAQAEFDVQYQKMLKLQDQAQDLASSNGIDNEKVTGTIDGLKAAVDFWGQFTGSDAFDKELMTKKMNELEAKRSKLQDYAKEDGTQAMIGLNQAIWDINVAIKSIQSLAVQLKGGAKNVKKIASIAFRNKEDFLNERETRIYNAAIKVLIKTLKSGTEKASEIKANLKTLADDLIEIEETLSSVSDRLVRAAKGEGEAFDEWASDLRAAVYGGCAASVLLGPGGVATCYSIGAITIETEIANRKEEIEGFKAEFMSWAETFSLLANMAGQAKEVSMKWYFKIESFSVELTNQHDLISGLDESEILPYDLEMRNLVDESLDQLIAKCDEVINDTTGRLEDVTQDMSAVVPELEQQEQEPLTVEEQVKVMCRNAHPNDQKRQMKCVKGTLARVQ